MDDEVISKMNEALRDASDIFFRRRSAWTLTFDRLSIGALEQIDAAQESLTFTPPSAEDLCVVNRRERFAQTRQ